MKLLFDQNLSFKLCSPICSLTPNRFESLVSTDPTMLSFGGMPRTTAFCSFRRIRISRI
jgi:hypothetical protein